MLIQNFIQSSLWGQISTVAQIWQYVEVLGDESIGTFVDSAFIIGDSDWVAIIPELFLGIALLTLWYLSTFSNIKIFINTSFKLVLILLLILILSNSFWFDNFNFYEGIFDVSRYASYSKTFLLLFIMPLFWLERIDLQVKFYLLSSVLFGFILIISSNLMGFYIALEALSLLSYGIIASSKTIGAAEAGLKYYIYGVVASALLIYGLSLQYLLLNSLLFSDIYLNSFLDITDSTIYLTSFVCVVSAFLYKLSIFPFHFTLADVYQGSSWGVISIINLSIKLSIALAFFHFWTISFSNSNFLNLESDFVIATAVASVVIGCFGALVQNSLKRFFAFTSINQAGFIVLGICCNSLIGIQVSLLYIVGYMLAMLVFFIIVVENDYNLDNMRDTLSVNTTQKLMLVVAIFSMAGIPPLLGFAGKYLVWLALIDGVINSTVLVVDMHSIILIVAFSTTIITSLISTFYYLRVIKLTLFTPSEAKVNIVESAETLRIINYCGLPIYFLVAWPFYVQYFWNLLFEWASSCRSHWC